MKAYSECLDIVASQIVFIVTLPANRRSLPNEARAIDDMFKSHYKLSNPTKADYVRACIISHHESAFTCA